MSLKRRIKKIENALALHRDEKITRIVTIKDGDDEEALISPLREKYGDRLDLIIVRIGCSDKNNVEKCTEISEK